MMRDLWKVEKIGVRMLSISTLGLAGTAEVIAWYNSSSFNVSIIRMGVVVFEPSEVPQRFE